MKTHLWNEISEYLSRLDIFDIYDDYQDMADNSPYSAPGLIKQYFFKIPSNSPYDLEVLEMVINRIGEDCFIEKIDHDLIDLGNPGKTLEDISIFKKDTDFICQLNYILY
jgi:hypothetical protein